MDFILRTVAAVSRGMARLAAPLASCIGAFTRKHPFIAQAAPLFGFLSTFILPFLGFGSGGVMAGSFAAKIQSLFYGGFVQAGSLFATLQSLGATIGGPVLVTTRAVFGALSFIVPFCKRWKSK